MRFSLVVGGLTLMAALLFAQTGPGLAAGRTQAQIPATSVASQQAFVQTYCVGCHNDRVKSGGFSWSQIDLAHPERNPKQSEEVIRKIRAGLMPPPGARRPEPAVMHEFGSAFATRIDELTGLDPYYKAPELHRINRREYRNAIRDVLGIDVEVSALLPPDSRTGAFDNMADALTVNPALMQA